MTQTIKDVARQAAHTEYVRQLSNATLNQVADAVALAVLQHLKENVQALFAFEVKKSPTSRRESRMSAYVDVMNIIDNNRPALSPVETPQLPEPPVSTPLPVAEAAREKLAALGIKSYNCDCLDAAPDGSVSYEEENSVYRQRWVVLAEDVIQLLPDAAPPVTPRGAQVNSQRDYNNPASWATGSARERVTPYDEFGIDDTKQQIQRLIGDENHSETLDQLLDKLITHALALGRVRDTSVNLRVICQAYDWDYHTDSGELWGLTAGDQGYEPTGIIIKSLVSSGNQLKETDDGDDAK